MSICPTCGQKTLKLLQMIQEGEKDTKHCPKCKCKLKEKMRKNEMGGWLQYFECSHCGQPLAFTKQLINHRLHRILYIDDVEHMGLMTSGVGGY